MERGISLFFRGGGRARESREGRRGDRGSSRHIHQLVLRAPACQTWQRADALLHTQAKHLACEKVLAGLASLARTLFFVSAVLSPQMKKKRKSLWSRGAAGQGRQCGLSSRVQLNEWVDMRINPHKLWLDTRLHKKMQQRLWTLMNSGGKLLQ